MVGNVLTIITITTSPLMGSPMYYFLDHLYLIDACYSCVNTLKLVVDLLYEKKTSTFTGCMIQIFGEHFFGYADVILLTVMAYDCYVAIYKPLQYAIIMNQQLCDLLVGVSWMGVFLHGFIQIFFIFMLPFWFPNVIDHFMCDLNPFLNLACTDTHTLGLFVAVDSVFICLINFLLLVGSYGVILHSQRLEARCKALLTCVSYITAVVIVFVPFIFVYLLPSATLTIDKAVAVFYTMITPMLNPLIYTLRNAQMKNGIRKLCSSKATSTEL
ncbi:olfactory receptor 4C13-like [Sus scrofa]|uniref:olfactory receptor 4C13-like n=1 Tax=Sus scrofa TaxID=9823 RepID=UPI000A2B03C6|nr:olfactory receptor 4C13-like [Sus scrofa]XP_020937682.1 olfactory receptor 4C13-like [Sus scrofa]